MRASTTPKGPSAVVPVCVMPRVRLLFEREIGRSCGWPLRSDVRRSRKFHLGLVIDPIASIRRFRSTSSRRHRTLRYPLLRQNLTSQSSVGLTRR